MSEIPVEWDPSEPGSVTERYERMREVRQKCPVAGTDLRGGVWTVLGYKALVEIASDPKTFSNGLAPRFGRKLPPLELDPPEHTVFRRLLRPFWLPSGIAAMEPSVRVSAVSLMQPLIDSGGGDLARGLAYPLPVMALCALLRISKENWDNIKLWAETSLGAESRDPAERAVAVEAHERLVDHAREMVEDRQAHPQDPEEDIASALLAARIDGEALDPELIAGVLRLLISAGHNSTTNGMGNVLLYLAEHPEAQAELRRRPEIIPAAIEELLRWQSPVQELARWATRDVELCGRQIKAGDRLGMLWGAGNRDETVFPDPDACIFERTPNRHLAFGSGIHQCLGAPMARMELRVVVEELLSRTESFEVAGPVERKPYHHMGVSRLPVRIVLAKDDAGLRSDRA